MPADRGVRLRLSEAGASSIGAHARRVAPAEWRALPLEVHALLADVPLHDATAIDLPGGEHLTLRDLRRVFSLRDTAAVPAPVRALFALRLTAGRLLGWDATHGRLAPDSLLARVPESLRQRSLVTPGTVDDVFALLYLTERESLAEIQNATGHAFICAALTPIAGGQRLTWGVYVRRTSWLTPLYMAVIEPFRRWIVYPAVFAAMRRAWIREAGARH